MATVLLQPHGKAAEGAGKSEDDRHRRKREPDGKGFERLIASCLSPFFMGDGE
jgi:hypothetical protein